jgi:MinD-like ATPase involved in chromosome partitioning or flagellar assembly
MNDQAAGLRKLVGRGDELQVISIVAAQRGVGKTLASTNLAAALMRAGRSVKLVDTPRAGLAFQYASGSHDGTPDIVLVDARAHGDEPYAGLERTEIVIVVLPDAESIKAGYALLKQVHHYYGISNVHVLANRVIDSRAAASIARNLADAAAHFLGVAVHYLGHIPQDRELEQAARLKKSVVDAFPIAESARQFRQIADQLLSLPGRTDLSELGNPMQQLVMSAAC